MPVCDWRPIEKENISISIPKITMMIQDHHIYYKKE